MSEKKDEQTLSTAVKKECQGEEKRAKRDKRKRDGESGIEDEKMKREEWKMRKKISNTATPL